MADPTSTPFSYLEALGLHEGMQSTQPGAGPLYTPDPQVLAAEQEMLLRSLQGGQSRLEDELQGMSHPDIESRPWFEGLQHGLGGQEMVDAVDEGFIDPNINIAKQLALGHLQGTTMDPANPRQMSPDVQRATMDLGMEVAGGLAFKGAGAVGRALGPDVSDMAPDFSDLGRLMRQEAPDPRRTAKEAYEEVMKDSPVAKRRRQEAEQAAKDEAEVAKQHAEQQERFKEAADKVKYEQATRRSGDPSNTWRLAMSEGVEPQSDLGWELMKAAKKDVREDIGNLQRHSMATYTEDIRRLRNKIRKAKTQADISEIYGGAYDAKDKAVDYFYDRAHNAQGMVEGLRLPGIDDANQTHLVALEDALEEAESATRYELNKMYDEVMADAEDAMTKIEMAAKAESQGMSAVEGGGEGGGKAKGDLKGQEGGQEGQGWKVYGQGEPYMTSDPDDVVRDMDTGPDFLEQSGYGSKAERIAKIDAEETAKARKILDEATAAVDDPSTDPMYRNLYINQMKGLQVDPRHTDLADEAARIERRLKLQRGPGEEGPLEGTELGDALGAFHGDIAGKVKAKTAQKIKDRSDWYQGGKGKAYRQRLKELGFEHTGSYGGTSEEWIKGDEVIFISHPLDNTNLKKTGVPMEWSHSTDINRRSETRMIGGSLKELETHMGWQLESRAPTDIPVPEQARFKRWFGRSKVVDEAGEPIRVYHSTTQRFDDPNVFDPDKGEMGLHLGTSKVADDASGASMGIGRTYPLYAKIENPLRLEDHGTWGFDSLRQRPDLFPEADLVAIHKKGNDELWGPKDMEREFHRLVKESGHDGIVYLNRREGLRYPVLDVKTANRQSDAEFTKKFPEATDSYIVFDPTQIKSATGNRGTYDPNDPDITRALVGGGGAAAAAEDE